LPVSAKLQLDKNEISNLNYLRAVKQEMPKVVSSITIDMKIDK